LENSNWELGIGDYERVNTINERANTHNKREKGKRKGKRGQYPF